MYSTGKAKWVRKLHGVMLLCFHMYRETIIRDEEIKIRGYPRHGAESWRVDKTVRSLFLFDLLRKVSKEPCCLIPTQPVGYVIQKWIILICHQSFPFSLSDRTSEFCYRESFYFVRSMHSLTCIKERK